MQTCARQGSAEKDIPVRRQVLLFLFPAGLQEAVFLLLRVILIPQVQRLLVKEK